MCNREEKENLTMSEFIEQCATKKDSKRRNAYKEIAKLFAKNTHWVNAEEIKLENGAVRTFILELDDVGFVTARDAITTINPSELCVKSTCSNVVAGNVLWYNIAPLVDNKLEIRFPNRKIENAEISTDFLFEQMVANLCKQANVKYSELFEGANSDHQ